MDWIWIFISFFGDMPFWTIFTAALICLFIYSKKIAKKMHWVYKYALPSVAVSAAFAYALKIMLKEPRICQGLSFCPSTYGFPSMHAAVAFAFSAAAIIYFRNDIRNNFRILALIMISFAVSFLIAYSRIAMGVHTIDEVVAGSLVGIALSSMWCLLYDSYLSKTKLSRKRK